MYKLTYAENNNLVKKNVGGWGGTVGSNTRGDFDKKGWTQAGGLVITPTDQLMGPVSACNCGGVPLGGMGLEQAANVSRCCHGQPPVYNSENFKKEAFSKIIKDTFKTKNLPSRFEREFHIDANGHIRTGVKDKRV